MKYLLAIKEAQELFRKNRAEITTKYKEGDNLCSEIILAYQVYDASAYLDPVSRAKMIAYMSEWKKRQEGGEGSTWDIKLLEEFVSQKGKKDINLSTMIETKKKKIEDYNNKIQLLVENLVKELTTIYNAIIEDERLIASSEIVKGKEGS